MANEPKRRGRPKKIKINEGIVEQALENKLPNITTIIKEQLETGLINEGFASKQAVSVMDTEVLKNLPEVEFTTTSTTLELAPEEIKKSVANRIGLLCTAPGSLSDHNQGIAPLNQEQITPETILKRAKWEDWQNKVLAFCNKEGITPDDLIEGYKKKKATLKDILGSTEQTTKNYMNERRQKKGLI